MRGRVHQRLGQFAPARAAFQATRRYAEAGAPDPMGLAVASLGEEARLDLIEAGLIESPWPVPEIAVDDAAAPRLIANAVRLYADQANRGSKVGLLSLGEVARRLMDPDLDRRRILAEPIVRRLLVAYVASKQPDYTWDDTTDLDSIVAGTIERVLSQPAPEPGPDLDRLAALAYQGGRYDLAEKLSEKASQPLGLWVRAKLALRRGDRADAVKDWMAALTAAGQDGPAASLDQDAKTRLRGEVAVMRLSEGEYRDSLQLLFPVAETYWGDVIYIAERVLTVDELKAFVDGLPPPSATLRPGRIGPIRSRTCAPCWRGGWSGSGGQARRSPISRRGWRVRQRKNVMRTAPMSRMPATTSPPSKPFGRDGSNGRGNESPAPKPCSNSPG